jgi:TubC N-terminal docking domain
MSPTELTQRLAAAGCQLRIDGEQLCVRYPGHALTDALRQSIREHKAELINLLSPTTTPQTAPEPSLYIKHCSTCDGTDWGPARRHESDGAEPWVCSTCDDAKPKATTICPVCTSDSILKDASGRVCYRSTCGWRESPHRTAQPKSNCPGCKRGLLCIATGITSCTECSYIFGVSGQSLIATVKPESTLAISDSPCCPVCMLSVDASVLCTHLAELRANAERFVRQEKLRAAERVKKSPYEVAPT